MEEYASNSYKSRELPEKKVEKVISGSAKREKKGKMQKAVDAFLSNDVGNIKSYIVTDILVPAAKKAISDIVREGTDIVRDGTDVILYGKNGRSRKGSTLASHVSYWKCSSDDMRRSRDVRDARSVSQTGYNYDDIIFETRGDAESVLDAMNDIIAQYGMVTVADLYDLADISSNNYAANKYGWTDIHWCRPMRVRDGYVLKLPRALPIDN